MQVHTGAAATITGAATSAASVGIVTTSSGAAGAAYYSSKMAKRAADISEFGFVRLAEHQEFREASDAVQAAEEVSASAESGLVTGERRGGDTAAGPPQTTLERCSAARRVKKSASSGWGWGKSVLRSSQSKLRRSAVEGSSTAMDASAGAVTQLSLLHDYVRQLYT